jgi:hypothetical protein
MSIKYLRARKMSVIGSCPGSFDAMWAAIPAPARAQLSGHQMAALVDGLWQLASASKRLADIETISNGFVWDYNQSHVRDLREAQPGKGGVSDV